MIFDNIETILYIDFDEFENSEIYITTLGFYDYLYIGFLF